MLQLLQAKEMEAERALEEKVRRDLEQMKAVEAGAKVIYLLILFL